MAIKCHCCDIEIYGCTGSTSWPNGDPFVGEPEFHCPNCTNTLLGPNCQGFPCHVQRMEKEK